MCHLGRGLEGKIPFEEPFDLAHPNVVPVHAEKMIHTFYPFSRSGRGIAHVHGIALDHDAVDLHVFQAIYEGVGKFRAFGHDNHAVLTDHGFSQDHPRLDQVQWYFLHELLSLKILNAHNRCIFSSRNIPFSSNQAVIHAGPLADKPPDLQVHQNPADISAAQTCKTANLIDMQPFSISQSIGNPFPVFSQIFNSCDMVVLAAHPLLYRKHVRPQKIAQFLKDVVGTGDQTPTLTYQGMASCKRGLAYLTGQSENLAPLFQGMAGRDKAAALACGFRHQNAQGNATDNTVAYGKMTGIRARSIAVFADQQPLCLQGLPHIAIRSRVNNIQSRSKHPHRRSRTCQSGNMGLTVDAAGHARNHGDTITGQFLAYPQGGIQAI
eukprot:TRINITY_DN9326_c0_g1_i1.p1 TRINITY_DN9326_c0_g1~~TRINITY_DN9326_c0_g1_i1.p1  ORF type:complete len:380 (+),score=43.21 TRINITY_DN9326_c0_g1_i1:2-1141(+)